MIFVTGDCHGNFERFKPKYFPEQAQMTKRDIVICAGDFGGVWFGDGRDEAGKSSVHAGLRLRES